MTTIYLMRHSEPFKEHYGIEDVHEDIFITNLKNPLSINGEKLAERISLNKEFDDLDVIWSSNYVRAMSTAKYFAAKNSLKVNISDKLGERKQGITTWEELPLDFEIHQFQNENYKIGNGESQKEVRNRLSSAFNQLLSMYNGKRVLIVGHATAFTFLLKTWCEINYENSYRYNSQPFFDGHWHYCETFKLEFDDNNSLLSIENLKF